MNGRQILLRQLDRLGKKTSRTRDLNLSGLTVQYILIRLQKKTWVNIKLTLICPTSDLIIWRTMLK